MIENQLQILGLKGEEIKIYLELLKRGQISVTAVAKFTKTPRINCYYHLQNLKKRGFVIESRKNKMKHFSAENPKIFLAKAQEQKNVAEQILPELESLTNTNSTKPKIQFFEDRTGIKQIFDRLTDQKTHTIFSFTNFQQLIQIVSLPILKKHFLERTKKGIKSRIICANNEIAQILNEEIFAKHTPFFEVFFVDEQKARQHRGVINKYIETTLQQTGLAQTCKLCSSPLPINSKYAICQSCFKKNYTHKRTTHKRH